MFTQNNTEGFSDAQLDRMNVEMTRLTNLGYEPGNAADVAFNKMCDEV